MNRAITAAFGIALVAGSSARANEIHVPGDYFTVTAGVANATAGDTVVIAAGFYPENVVVGKNLTIRGAGTGSTIMEGQGLDSVFTVVSGADVTFEDLTIQNGGGPGTDRGGAIKALDSGAVVIVRNCELTDNHTSCCGGGLYINAGTLTMEDTTVSGNSAGSGGGLYLNSSNATLTNVSFLSNSATASGGGLRHYTGSLTIDACTFIGNTSDTYGGAAILEQSGVKSVRDSWFESNTAARGGAIWAGSTSDLVNSVFVDNTASQYGGAIFSGGDLDAMNCTFSGNTADVGAGDTFESPAGTSTELLNCVVVNAAAASKSGGGAFVVHNSIIPEGPSGTPDANGNLSDDPMFANAASGDFHLLAGSPAIDSGDSLGSLGGTLLVTDYAADFDGNDRNLDDPATPNTGVPAWALNIDMGAFEFQPAGGANPCIADTTTTGAAIGDPGYGVPDGMVTTADIQYYVNAFVAGCP